MLNTVGVVIGFPSTVTNPIPCGEESTVTLTIGMVVVVDAVVPVAVVPVAVVPVAVVPV